MARWHVGTLQANCEPVTFGIVNKFTLLSLNRSLGTKGVSRESGKALESRLRAVFRSYLLTNN